MTKKITLSESDRSRACGLAVTAMQKISKPKFTVWATLDIEKPKTIKAFDRFGEALLDAYNLGVADAKAEQAALEVDREHDASERG
jgi:hypothetical protein